MHSTGPFKPCLFRLAFDKYFFLSFHFHFITVLEVSVISSLSDDYTSSVLNIERNRLLNFVIYNLNPLSMEGDPLTGFFSYLAPF